MSAGGGPGCYPDVMLRVGAGEGWANGSKLAKGLTGTYWVNFHVGGFVSLSTIFPRQKPRRGDSVDESDTAVVVVVEWDRERRGGGLTLAHRYASEIATRLVAHALSGAQCYAPLYSAEGRWRYGVLWFWDFWYKELVLGGMWWRRLWLASYVITEI